MSRHGRPFLAGAVAAALLLLAATLARAECVPMDLPNPAPRDPLARALAQQDACPKSAQALSEALVGLGVRLEPTMVNFVGFHNPAPGAFFLFEIASSPASAALPIARGDLVFGHFTQASGGRLVANRQGLVVEAIAWDPAKGFYGFYELVDGQWFYRGDSKDVLDDVQSLHRARPAGAPPFGGRLRCSGCHVSGGLVQKELSAPHNDWHVGARPLPLGGLVPDAFVKEKLAALVDAEELSRLVADSARRLADSPGYQDVLAARTLQERLRPLFCPVEVNLESDEDPADPHVPSVRVPSGFFVDARLGTVEIDVPRAAYDAALRALNTRLPGPSGRGDADHAWLTPVKAHSDVVAVEALVARKLVDAEFVADVLAVDAGNPVFSATRCGLLRLVPQVGGPDFTSRFQEALRGSSAPGASVLRQNLEDPARTAAFHRQAAASLLATCRQRAQDPAAVAKWVRLLAQRRAEVSASEISRNPRGHILEDPGRVVFPSSAPAAVPGRLSLTSTCDVE